MYWRWDMESKKSLIKSIFAELSEKSKQICGNDSLKNSLYLDLLKRSGIETYKVAIKGDKLEAFKKKSKFDAFKVLEEKVVLHQVYMIVELPEIGLSDLDAEQIEKIKRGEKIV